MSPTQEPASPNSKNFSFAKFCTPGRKDFKIHEVSNLVHRFYLRTVSIKLNATLLGGSEWGNLDNTKHLIYWLCNMKQLNFRHFHTELKFTETVNFSKKKQKRLQKGQYYFV